MSDSKRQDLLAKMRAIMNRANPEMNNFQEEIDTASKMLEKLMAQHSVTWAELHEFDDTKANKDEFGPIETSIVFGKVTPWHWMLARAIARMTNGRYFIRTTYGKTYRESITRNSKVVRGHCFVFFGQKDMAQLAVELFEKWHHIIYQMAQAKVKEHIERLAEMYEDEMRYQAVKQVRHLSGLGSDHPNVWQISWLEGVTYGINDALKEQEQEREVSTDTSEQKASNAIVLISKAVTAAYDDFANQVGMRQSRSSNNGSRNWDAFNKGKTVGQGLNLTAKELKQ